MKNNNLKLFIVPDYACMSVKIWARESHGDIIQNFSTGVDGVICTTIKNGEAIPSNIQPLLSLPMSIAEALFDKIFEYKLNAGAKVQDRDLIEGRLIATEKHLDDMREISMKLLDSKLGIK